MSDIWNKVYANDASFFGDNPSNFGLECYEEFKKHGVKKILELGCGQGRDALFFASNGLDVVTIDSSQVAINVLSKIITKRNSRLKQLLTTQLKVFHLTIIILMQSILTCSSI